MDGTMQDQTKEMITHPALVKALKTSTSARNQALTLVDDVSRRIASGTTTLEDQLEVSKRQKMLIAHLAILRGCHRDAVHSGRDTKAQTTTARQEVDTLHLQLQNLYYEQRHLQGEIDACESYDHKYTHLPLVSVEELLSIKPELEGADEVALMIARIDHEHAEREALEQQRQGLLKKKQGLIADNKKRKDDLASLDTMLEKFIEGARPIQKVLEKSIAS